MKKFAVAIIAFQKNGSFDADIIFVDADSNIEAWEMGMGKAFSLYPGYQGYTDRMCTVKAVPE